MRISIFRDKFGPAPLTEEVTWEEFVRALGPHIVGEKEAQYLFSPGEWVPGAEKRTKENVVAVHFGVLDFDCLSTEDLQLIQSFLAPLEETWLLYSTHSHGANMAEPGEAPRYEGALRLCLPFSRPVSVGDWPRVWPRLLALLGGLGDQSCKDPGRLFYFPTCAPERAHLAIFHAHAGKDLDVDSLLEGALPGVEVAPRKDPINRAALRGLLAKLKKKNASIATSFARMLEGEPWADSGARDTTLYVLAGAIAREFPHADMATVAQEFLTSVQRIRLEDPSTHISMGLVLDKLTRCQVDQLSEERAKEDAALREKQSRIRQAFQGKRSEPYTVTELDTFANEAQISRFDFLKRWIIQVSGSYYFFLDGSYVGPYPSSSATGAARMFLAPASSAGVELDRVNQLGGWSPKPIEVLALDYGTVVKRIVGDIAAQKSVYDVHSDAIIEATCPLRPIVPQYHEPIALWLNLLGGSSVGLLNLWISYLLDLDKTCAALYLEGVPGSGKSLLAKGLSRLWREGAPTTLDQAMGKFNDAISTCPLVFADETMPTDFRGRSKTSELRAFIQEESRPWARKFIPDGILRGSCRVIVAANNRSLIQGEESLTANDVEAIAGRILHIEAPRAAAEYLVSTDTRGWINEDKIAEHAAWLCFNAIKPKNPPRFLIPQEDRRGIQRAIVTSTAMGSAVCHWLVSFLLDPTKLRAGAIPNSSACMVKVFYEKLCVNVRAIVEHWERYQTNVDLLRVTPHSVGRVLSALSVGAKRQHLGVNYHVIDTFDLLEWVDSNGYTDSETIIQKLKQWSDDDAS